jgi:hypothetical protein
MRYLKTYYKFNEDLEISENDTDDVKNTKQSVTDIQNNIKEYKEKKSKIDAIYNISNTTDPSKEIAKVMGDSKNIFLNMYNTIMSTKHKVDVTQKKLADKVTEMGRMRDLESTSEPKDRTELNKRISEVQNQTQLLKKEIAELSKKIPNMEQEFKKKLSDTENEIKSWGDKLKT